MRRNFTMAVLTAAMVCSAPGMLSAQQPGKAQAPKAGPAEFTIGGDTTAPLTLSGADLKKMERVTLHVENPHSKKAEVYEGVPLAVLLEKAGVPHGERLRGPWMAAYVLAEAADGYRVVFSIAELDSAFLDSSVIVADTLDGAPMGPGEGPFKLVAPHEKRPARWVRMLKSIKVVKLPGDGP